MGKRKSKARHDIVIVHWIDQHYTHGPMEKSELGYKVQGWTTGWLVFEDAEQIGLAAEYFSHNETYRHIIHIPKCAILSTKRVKT